MDHRDELRLLRGACAASRTGAWSYRLDEDVVEWTPLLYELFALSEDTELTLELALSFYVGSSRERVSKAVQRCLSEGSPWNLDVQCRSVTGRMFWARTIGEALVNEGRVVALQGAFQDITRERHAVDDQERAQAELAFVLRTMPDGFFLLDSEWRFSFVNAASEQLMRRNAEDIVGCSIWDEFPGTRGSIIEETYLRVKDTGTSQSIQTYFQPLEAWFDITVHPAQTGIAVHFSDVTQEVGEQRDLRLFRTAIDAMNSGAILLERQADDITSWNITYANKAVLALWKAGHHFLVGQEFGRITRNATVSPELSAIQNSLVNLDLCEFELILDRFGHQQIFDGVAVPLTGGNNHCAHAVIIMDDVTERRRMNEERHRSERLALIGQMAGGVSHDFNNLLAVILGNIELLELTTNPQEAAILVGEARDAVMRGKALNDSLLAFAGKSRLKPQTADLATFMRSLVPLVQRAIPSRIKLEIIISEALPPVLIDTAMAESCLLNVVINARESIIGNGTIRIRLDASQHSNPNGEGSQTWVRLAVEDTGCGIPDQLRQHVFEPFFTTRSVGQGSGLGLSRVRGYLEQIGGFVTLSSAVGEGTTVAMFFAVSPVDTRDPDTRDPESSLERIRKLKALVVDDTPAVSQVIARMLNSLGCSTLIASNGGEARDIIMREADLDIVISDVVMPGENGVELARSISIMRPDVRIALMSGYTQDDLLDTYSPSGIAFFSKPVSRAQLMQFVRSSSTTP